MQELYREYETEMLVMMYQTDNDEAILEEIIDRNKRLLHMWVNGWDNLVKPWFDKNDLFSEALIALWMAVKRFDPEKGVKFTTFLKVCVKQRFSRIRTEHTRKRRYNGTTVQSIDEVAEDKGVEIVIEKADLSGIEVMSIIEALTGRIREIAMFLIEGYSKTEISKMLSVSNATTSYYVRRLRGYLS